jgi:hypothetical protein
MPSRSISVNQRSNAEAGRPTSTNRSRIGSSEIRVSEPVRSAVAEVQAAPVQDGVERPGGADGAPLGDAVGVQRGA